MCEPLGLSVGAPDPWLVLVGSLAVGLVPLLVVMTTAFTKISIVLALLRNGLGIQQAPSNLALAGIALAVTMLVMAPVWGRVAGGLDLEGIANGEHRPSVAEVFEVVSPPLTAFMQRHVDPQELASLTQLVRDMHAGHDDVALPSGLSVLIPAFVISEIGAAFKIGMLLAIGFAVIDLIVANLLMAMGMTMFPPSTVAIPLKLLVFVLVAGFSRLIHGLIASYPL